MIDCDANKERRKCNVSRVIPRLYGWVYKTLRLSPLVDGHSVVVMSARLNPMGSQFSIPVLWKLCSESDTGGRVHLPLGWNTYVLFNTGIVSFMWKTDEREAYLKPTEIVSFSSRSFSHLNQIWFQCETPLLFFLIILYYIFYYSLTACNFIKNRLQHRCFPAKLAKFLRTVFLRNISGHIVHTWRHMQSE